MFIPDIGGFFPVDVEGLAGLVEDIDVEGTVFAGENVGEPERVIFEGELTPVIFLQLRGIDSEVLIGRAGRYDQQHCRVEDKVAHRFFCEITAW